MSAAEPALHLVPAELADAELSTDHIASRIVGLAGRLAVATCRWLLLVAEFDRRDGAARWGLTTTAAWLSHTCSLSRRTAFEHVRVARALADSPLLVQQMQRGRLSYSQVRAITRVATADDPSVVAGLVQTAHDASIGHLESVVRGMRGVERNENGVPVEQDYVRTGWTATSQWQLNARLAPELGALVESALDVLCRADGLTRAEALVRMAEIALAAVNDSATPPRPLRGEERAAVVVHLDATTLAEHADAQRSGERSGGRAEVAGHIADGPGVSWRVLDRLLCQGRIRTVVHDDGDNIQQLGRTHRVVPARMFRALMHRDHGCCAFPGCRSRAGLQAHHVQHWIKGGPTELANLLLLCERHHHLHHDEGFEIEIVAPGRFRFVLPDTVPGRITPTDLSAPVDVETLGLTSGDIEVEPAEVEPAEVENAAAAAIEAPWDYERYKRAYDNSFLSRVRHESAGPATARVAAQGRSGRPGRSCPR